MIHLSRPFIGDEERAAVDEVLRSGHLASGPRVERFETEFATFSGAAHGAAVNSGTAALVLGLLALGVEPGDEVIVPSFTFAASANAIRLVGAIPVFAEIDPTTYNIDPDHVAALIGPATAALMPVHLYGQPADMGTLMRLADARGIRVLEDAAQAHGASVDDRTVGSIGHAAAFSFYPTKNMTTGEGGMVTTDDADLAKRVKVLRNQGMDKRYVHDVVGYNERMTEIAAAIGLVQLGRLPAWTEARRANAVEYDRALAGSGVVPPAVAAGATHVYHQYTVRVRERDRVAAALTEQGVGAGVYYPIPTHRQAPYAGSPPLPETEKAADEVLSIPVRPDLTALERDRVVEALLGTL